MKGPPANIAYPKLSALLIGAFVYFWLLTIAVGMFYRPVRNYCHRQVLVYNTFWRQNWRLFAYTKLYNRQLNLLIHHPHQSGKTDTLDIVQWSLSQKRSHAPFNNYQDALDHLLYNFMNTLEMQMSQQLQPLAAGHPGISDSARLLAASAKLAAQPEILHNLVAYAIMMMKDRKPDTTGCTYSLQLVHRFIPPATSKEGATQRILFQSPFQPFK